jgi:trehalose-phosphatase
VKSFWTHWPALKKKIEGKKVLLLLDFDGTLVGIARTPDEVRFTDRTCRLLTRLRKKKNIKVAIISGRYLKDLLSYFNLKGLIYVGNHGLEMKAPGVGLPREAKKARRLKFLMWRLFEKLKTDFYYLPGILVEDKVLTVSLHFRNLTREHKPAFDEVLHFFQRRYRNHPLVWKCGKKVWEIFPKVHWHKGFAALHLLKHFRGYVPVAVGDDRTDEDMFKAVRRFGITVRVGRKKDSHAEYYVKSQKEVDRLLEGLSDERSR